MDKKKIIKYLKDIENISSFQQKRILNKKEVNQELVLKLALNFILKDLFKIEELMK